MTNFSADAMSRNKTSFKTTLQIILCTTLTSINADVGVFLLYAVTFSVSCYISYAYILIFLAFNVSSMPSEVITGYSRNRINFRT